MSNSLNLSRKTHFLGTKIRSLRKTHGLTLEDLSVRCIQVNAEVAPSISYLSLIETGRRVPSEKLLKLMAEVFQKEIEWFLDESLPSAPVQKISGSLPGIDMMSLEPNFLFSKEILESAIPAMLNQSGTSGRQFAHILIRSYQEKHQNQFPDLERAAENVGKKKLPLSVQDLLKLCTRQGLKIKWFQKESFTTRDDSGREINTFFRSFYDSPNTIYLNESLKKEPVRLKYDLASMLGHKVLHNGDGILSSHATGGELGGSPRPKKQKSGQVQQEDILYAWRDFESSFFAGALLCPKLPFRNFLNRQSYDITSCEKLGLTPAVVMRRMTAVSTYKYWHYFDAYPPGYLRAVYRGNGISIPWGNMRLVTDPCNQWDIFKLISNLRLQKPITQISLMKDGNLSRLYASTAVKTKDANGEPHVVMVGIDLMPAMESQGINTQEFVEGIKDICLDTDGASIMPKNIRNELEKVGRVLNISWVVDGASKPVNIICPRSTSCPRLELCGKSPVKSKISWMNEIKDEILENKGK
jgi:transcriptional regulator with XRE-family HTH domain/Zn-dependent peptidase ImmA (M78 family)